jgi:hypothetical protein
LFQTSHGDTETSKGSSNIKGVRVQILDWIESGDVLIGEGEFCSDDPLYKVGRIPIGHNIVGIMVKSVITPQASLWKPPSEDVSTIGLAVEKLITDREISSSEEDLVHF